MFEAPVPALVTGNGFEVEASFNASLPSLNNIDSAIILKIREFSSLTLNYYKLKI
jgi:hypothetical protein